MSYVYYDYQLKIRREQREELEQLVEQPAESESDEENIPRIPSEDDVKIDNESIYINEDYI